MNNLFFLSSKEAQLLCRQVQQLSVRKYCGVKIYANQKLLDTIREIVNKDHDFSFIIKKKMKTSRAAMITESINGIVYTSEQVQFEVNTLSQKCDDNHLINIGVM